MGFLCSLQAGSPRRDGRRPRWLVLSACAAMMVLVSAGPAIAAPADTYGEVKRVLILQSFGSDFAPYNALSSSFRTELTRTLGEPLAFLEVSVQGASSTGSAIDDALTTYLIALNAESRPDLVVVIGGVAARWMQSHRDPVFSDTPVLFAGVDQRLIPTAELRPHDATVPAANDVPAVVDTILRVLPQTENVAVLIGHSPLERYWRAEFDRELEPYQGRVRLLWWDDLPAPEILAHAAELPPRSAILYVLFLVDAANVPQGGRSVLTDLHEVASAPIFGLFDTQLGDGVVGGPMMPVETLSRLSVTAAANVLRGGPPAERRFQPVQQGPPVFDWRELRRWRIPESSLPAGSIVRYRPQSPWVQYRWPILGGLLTIAVLAGLVAALLLQRAHRRVAQREVRALSRRLLTASEDERRWLARELHDDLAQRLARLAIDAARLERGDAMTVAGVDLAAMRSEIVSMSSEVHALSHRLHPSLLDNLGLEAALRAEAERFADSETIDVGVRIDELRAKPSPDAALCLYRIAQEALRNVARHARAERVEISLQMTNGGCQREVRDDGVGFDPARLRPGASLGHASMRERVRLVGGRLTIRNVPHRGTAVVAWVPLQGGGA
ncbi:MAG TPA: sensor histidine kinase [Thermoanaerobaculales bacterium]|nr:sensor histidine kinase [Thermoanaerobaculales bacterium]HQL29509.1 sensor histidine kinase [Thermoanaerobaculales bacterium]